MVRSMIGKHPHYYEAVLQLREVTPEVLEYAKKEISKANIHIAKALRVRNGHDYYLSDNDFTKKLGRKLQDHFGGEYAVTATLYSRKDGRDIYRLTVLFRGMSFKKGDIVSFRGEHHNVLNITKEIVLQETHSGKKVRVKFKDLRSIKPARQLE